MTLSVALQAATSSLQQRCIVAVSTPLAHALPPQAIPLVAPTPAAAASGSGPGTGQPSDVRPPGRTEAAEATAAGAVADPAKALSASEVLTRQPAACARKCYEAEQSLLRAQQPGCATYVVCPGVLYGQHLGPVALHSLRHWTC